MSDTQTAMKELSDALARLEGKFGSRLKELSEKDKVMEEMNVTCAHLRAEVSTLKKELTAQTAAGARASQQIDHALAQIDDVLGASHG